MLDQNSLDQPQQTDAPAWTIVRVINTKTRNVAGQYEDGYQVTFQLMDGTTSTITVPGSDFSAQAVEKLITAEAGKLYAVLSLEGPRIPTQQG